MPESQPRDRSAGAAVVPALTLAAVALAAYWPAMRGRPIWDDSAHLTRAGLRSIEGLWRIWFDLGATVQYYPFLHSAFWVEYHTWGGALAGYHVWNVVLHAFSAFLVVRIVRRLGLPGAWLAGLVFALHPICVEAVAWIAEQKSTLSGVFYLGAALSYLEFNESRQSRRYYLALGLFVLALLSKSVTATLPAVLLVVLWWRKGRLEWARDIRPLSGWLVLGLGSGLFTAWVERTYVGAQGAEYSLTPVQHILLAGRVVWFYLEKILWPANLIFNYPRWDVDPREWWQYLYPLGALLVLAISAVLARRRRGPLAAELIFTGTLAPVLGFLNVYPFRYSFVADHFAYLASLAIIVPVCAVLAGTAQRLALPRPAAAAWAGLLVVALGVGTWRQAHFYADAETLYRETLERNPGSSLALLNLCAVLLQSRDRLAEAESTCEESLRERPDLAESHLNIGILRQWTGRLPEALSELRTAVRIRPRSGAAHYNLGNALAASGQLPEALAEFQAALRIDPENPQFYAQMGNALRLVAGREKEAAAAYDSALRIFPCDADALYGRATLLAQSGRTFDAITDLEHAVECQPDYQPAVKLLKQLEAGR